jgi:hypothetical protein
MSGQQAFHAAAKLRVGTACLGQVPNPLWGKPFSKAAKKIASAGDSEVAMAAIPFRRQARA